MEQYNIIKEQIGSKCSYVFETKISEADMDSEERWSGFTSAPTLGVLAREIYDDIKLSKAKKFILTSEQRPKQDYLYIPSVSITIPSKKSQKPTKRILSTLQTEELSELSDKITSYLTKK